MSSLDRAFGLARSVAIYHAIPGRQRRLRRLYAGLVGPGDLVFDIGAHVGNHVRALAAMGCRVVALEPQPDCARLLRGFFADPPRVVIVEAGAGASRGRASLAISDRTPTVTSIASAWRDRRAQDPDFSGVRWNRRLEIATTTLDLLIEEYGVPAFVKIDVEGHEPMVLSGLSQPIRGLAFEYLPRALDSVEASLARLATLGSYTFNWSPGETYQFAETTWLPGPELLASLRRPAAQQRSGDVYARLTGAS
jgi:FkbM family methyltransferase